MIYVYRMFAILNTFYSRWNTSGIYLLFHSEIHKTSASFVGRSHLIYIQVKLIRPPILHWQLRFLKIENMPFYANETHKFCATNTLFALNCTSQYLSFQIKATTIHVSHCFLTLMFLFLSLSLSLSFVATFSLINKNLSVLQIIYGSSSSWCI